MIDWKTESGRGVVVAGGADAATAGALMFRKGGNAVDAAVATLFALSVTDYGMYAIGGEIPMIIHDARTKSVKVLSGVGCAPLDPDAIQWFMKYGIPDEGSLKSSPVPAAFDLCVTALKLHGELSYGTVIEPTIQLLESEKQPWHRNNRETFLSLVETENNAGGERDDKLQKVRDRFYRGDIADKLEEFYTKNGSFLRKRDLEGHRTRVEDPISISYKGYEVFKCDSWTQGPVLCQMLRLLETFDLKQMGHLSADYIHVVVEAMKLAFADRDAYYADPLFATVPLETLLSEPYTELRRGLIDLSVASSQFCPGDPVSMKALLDGDHRPESWESGTTTCVAADASGNVVAATPSMNRPYFICEELGIAHGNRLRCLNTDPNHPNCIEAGKRPRITLTPTLARRADTEFVAISVAGGDMQDQTSLNCFLNHVEFSMPPQDAVCAPRFVSDHHENSFSSNPNRVKARVNPLNVRLNAGISEHVRQDLVDRGHIINLVPGAIAHPVMLHLDRAAGMISGAGDPKASRHAASA